MSQSDGRPIKSTFEYRVVSEYGSLRPWVEPQPTHERAVEVQGERSAVES